MKIKPIELTKENLDAFILQAQILKNYYSMLETHLKLVRNNLETWHSMFIYK